MAAHGPGGQAQATHIGCLPKLYSQATPHIASPALSLPHLLGAHMSPWFSSLSSSSGRHLSVPSPHSPVQTWRLQEKAGTQAHAPPQEASSLESSAAMCPAAHLGFLLKHSLPLPGPLSTGESGLGPQRTGVSDKPLMGLAPGGGELQLPGGGGARVAASLGQAQAGSLWGSGSGQPLCSSEVGRDLERSYSAQGARRSGLCHLEPRSL